MMPKPGEFAVASLDAGAAAARLPAWMPLYNACFNPPPWNEPTRGAVEYTAQTAWHLEQPGFTALEARTPSGLPAGVAYGWPTPVPWPDTEFYRAIVRDLPPHHAGQLAARGTFEVVELMVDPAMRGRGLARMLLDTLIANYRRAWLCTLPESPAAAMYRRWGWREMGVFDTDRHPRLEAYLLIG
ncbi:GNAT family N-acetyltransferase [Nocardia crassostreae]|uniref:GNAT family N-acetyltransferase n=1 Tax=Nocardia crassostreae TaxID=53428 RepID=UPI00082DE75F|nr:GNAT family N-acetyltransferase [Nocardia crassostreae]